MGEGIGNGAHHRRIRGGRKTYHRGTLQRYEEQSAAAASMPCDVGRRIHLHSVYVGEGHGHLGNDTRSCLHGAHRRQPGTRSSRNDRRNCEHPHGRLEEDNREMVNGIQCLQHDKELRLQRRGRTAHVVEYNGNMGGIQRYGTAHQHSIERKFRSALSACQDYSRNDIHLTV